MGARGEGTINLVDGEDVTVLFTNRALADVEKLLNKPIVAIANELANGQGSVTVIAQLIRVGMEASGRSRGTKLTVSINKVYDIMDTVGFIPAMQVVMTSLTECLTYDHSKH